VEYEGKFRSCRDDDIGGSWLCGRLRDFGRLRRGLRFSWRGRLLRTNRQRKSKWDDDK